jgi:hypothetical protein
VSRSLLHRNHQSHLENQSENRTRRELFFDCLVLYDSFGVEGHRLSVVYMLRYDKLSYSYRLHFIEINSKAVFN